MGFKEKKDVMPGVKEELETIFTEENKKKLLLMAAGAAVLYFLLPLAVKLLSQEVQANIEIIRLLILNQILIGVIGWQANYFKKYGIYIPLVFIVIFAISEMVFYGVITWSMEVEYMQTGYILFFLRKFLGRKMAMDEKKKNKPFPKNVTGRK